MLKAQIHSKTKMRSLAFSISPPASASCHCAPGLGPTRNRITAQTKKPALNGALQKLLLVRHYLYWNRNQLKFRRPHSLFGFLMGSSSLPYMTKSRYSVTVHHFCQANWDKTQAVANQGTLPLLNYTAWLPHGDCSANIIIPARNWLGMDITDKFQKIAVGIHDERFTPALK